MVAASPSGTGFFVPVRAPLANFARTVRGLAAVGPSEAATVPIASPLASSGRYFFFCAALPASLMASLAR